MKNSAAKKQGDKTAEITGMETIPPALIKSLYTLGLTNYEARVYATLVLFDHAEAKEIVEYLSLSKPSVYEALENLAERGLAVKQNSKPARYRAISPEMAIAMLMGDHEKASERALSALKKLESEKLRPDTEDAIWTIYGDANIEYKIRDLFSKAKNHVTCILGDRYVSFLENVHVRDIPLRLVVLSGSPGLEEKMHALFPGKNAEIRIVPPERYHSPPPSISREFVEALKFMKFENVLELNVDDEELLIIPPFFHGSSSMLNTRNKGALHYLKILGEVYRDWFFEGDTSQHPPPPHEKRKRTPYSGPG
jgi:predicted transcriptional regulator